MDYLEGDERFLDAVEPLWRDLNEHHRKRSSYFADWFAGHTFDARKKTLLKRAGEGALLVELARDPGSGANVGYCVTSLDADKKGEIESIYIIPEHRGRQIGDHFMQRALSWLDAQGALDISITVAHGNEEALGFYRRYGFYPRTYVLRRSVGDGVNG